MKIQILWVAPAEHRFGSGDILTKAELEAIDVSLNDLLDSGDAQIVDPLDHDADGRKGGSRPRKAKAA